MGNHAQDPGRSRARRPAASRRVSQWSVPLMVRRWNVPGRRRGGALTSARTRLMVSYVVILVSFGAFSTVALREVVARGRDPRTGRPFGSDLRAVFDLFLERNVPSRDEAHATFLDGRPHKA